MNQLRQKQHNYATRVCTEITFAITSHWKSAIPKFLFSWMFTGNYKSGQTNLICISPEAQYFFAKCLAAILNCWSRGRLGRKKILISGWAIGERNKGKRPPVIGYPRDRAPIRIKNFVIGTISRWYQLVWLQNGLPDLFK